jgi:stage II sporulation protein AA (anti-sigma F factor antagonist)
MEIARVAVDGSLVVAPAGRIDSTTSEALERALADALDGGARRMVVDFADVGYISSVGLRVLLVVAKRIRTDRGTLVLCSLGDSVRQVFDLAGFLPLFTVEPTRELAVKRATAP